MVLFPHFNTACNWNLKTLLLFLEIIDGCAKIVADGEWYYSLMNLNPAAGKPKAQILVLLPKLWNPWVQNIWEKNSCSFLNKTGKETRGVLRFGAGLLEYLSFQQQCRFLQKTEEQERRTRERAREAAGARTNSSEAER
jgi:hypothetical protein